MDRPPDAGCGFHCGGCLTLRCDLTDADVHRSAQRPERRSHLACKEFRLFPGEIIPVPRSWAERAYPNLVYFNELKKGGHFAAWEQPELFAGEMRAAFRSLR